MNRMIPTTLVLLVLGLTLPAKPARAQGRNMREEMRKRMEEISRLMRESEKLLLEITRVDRLVRRQAKIVEELKRLEPPDRPKSSDAAGEAKKERQKRGEELKGKQAEVARQLNQLFDGQKQRGEGAARELMELLKNWPKSGGQGQGKPDEQRQKRKQGKPRDKQEQDKEIKNRDKPHSPREKKDLFKNKPKRTKRPPDKKQAARQARRIDAWIARLPPEQLERINRGDLSFIPTRYRRLIREYTAKRAKREAEEDTDNR